MLSLLGKHQLQQLWVVLVGLLQDVWALLVVQPEEVPALQRARALYQILTGKAQNKAL